MREFAATEWPRLLRPGMRVFVTGSGNEPAMLVDALKGAPECAAGVTFVQFPLAGVNQTDSYNFV